MPIVPHMAARMQSLNALTTAEAEVSAHLPPRLCENPLLNWLLGEEASAPSARELTRRLARTLLALGFPLLRLRITVRTLHPQYLGASYTWTRGADEIDLYTPGHEIVATAAYLNSPYAAIFEGAGGIRRRLDGPAETLEFPILKELKAQGATDYVALPLRFSDGKIAAITLAADRPGGFTTAQLEMTYQALPALARLVEVHALRRTARTILETYLGRHSAERVWNGRIRRGDGENIHAVIWFSDLRGSTALAERMKRAEFLALLNDYFECMAGAVLDHGGEVLRFIGDAALAIFPIRSHSAHPEKCPEHIRACCAALDAARNAAARVAHVNRRRTEEKQRTIGFGIGLHLGDVLYGNIGVPERLEFTVIGPAANQAARIEAMCKVLDRRVLISEAFARVVPERLISLGVHALRGVPEPHELFTLPED